MVGVCHDQGTAVRRDDFGDTPGCVIRFAAAVDEKAVFQPLGHRCGEALGIVDDCLVEIAGV